MKAIVIENKNGKTIPTYTDISEDNLPDGEIIIDVTHSALNYSDAATMYNTWGTVEDFPHVPGIDFIGTISQSSNLDYKVGQRFMHTSYGVGYDRWGGLAEKAVSNGDWLVPVPDHISNVQAMGLGTVGLTAMLAIEALERNGVKPEDGKILVTGATGGVGSLSVQLLAKLAYIVVASTGKIQKASAYLKKLGASQIIDRHLFDDIKGKPLEKETYAGFIDPIGGNTFTRAVKQLKYEGVGVSTGLVSGTDLDLSILPFVYRAISLVGINTVYTPREKRLKAWERLFELVDLDILDESISIKKLKDVPKLAKDTLEGKNQGRIVIEI